MITRCAGKITTWMIKQDAVVPRDRELYEYAVYSLILTVSPLVLVMVIGGLMGMFTEGIVLIIPFMAIRKFSGGYHAKHSGVCLLTSCGVLFLCVCLASHITCSMGLCIATFGAAASLCVWSPIDSENRRLMPDEKKRYKKTTCIIAALFAMVFVFLLAINADTYAVCVAVGLLLSASLQLPCILLQLRKTGQTQKP